MSGVSNKKKMQSFLLRWWWITAADSAAKCIQRVIRGVKVRRSSLGMKVSALINWLRPLIPLYKALRSRALVRQALKSLMRHRINCEEERSKEQEQQFGSRMLRRLRTACQVIKKEYAIQRKGICFCLDKQQRKGIALLLVAVTKAKSMKHAALYFDSIKVRHALDLLKRNSESLIQIPTGDSKRSRSIKEKSASTIRIEENVPNTDAVESLNAFHDNRVKEAKYMTGSGNSAILMEEEELVIRQLLPKRDDPLYFGDNIRSRVVEVNRKGAACRPFPSKGL
jgi:hypothetical protein